MGEALGIVYPPRMRIHRRAGHEGIEVGAVRAGFAALAALVAGCNCPPSLTVESTRAGGLSVAIAADGWTCRAPRITLIDVMQGPELRALWRARAVGERATPMRGFVYGRLPAGFVEDTPPAPLVPDQEVYVNVLGPSQRGSISVMVTP